VCYIVAVRMLGHRRCYPHSVRYRRREELFTAPGEDNSMARIRGTLYQCAISRNVVADGLEYDNEPISGFRTLY
jgi:hypothetical protein